MLREIIKPTGPLYTMRLPEEMIGKTVEVIAFEVGNEIEPLTQLTFEERIQRIKAITKNSLVDLTGFKFNRDEANNYDA
jgi:hypothetical protein